MFLMDLKALDLRSGIQRIQFAPPRRCAQPARLLGVVLGAGLVGLVGRLTARADLGHRAKAN